MSALCDGGWDVSLETSGALPIAEVDSRVSRIVDIKTPGSGEVSRNHWPNLAELTPRDEVKLVITNADDYAWAKETLQQHQVTQRCPVLLSPAWGSLPPANLAEWVLRDGLQVRVQVQLHKLLWGEAKGR